jgi:hypothetical protein
VRKWRRRITRGLVTVVLLWALVCVALPAAVSRSRRHRIVDALTSARSVRIEQFEDRTTLAQHVLNAEQLASLVREIPAIVSGALFSFKMCFVPHHRIIARDPEGVEFTITICFQCDMVQLTGSEPYDMPPSGSAALRQLFQQYGIQVADPDDRVP